MIEHGISSFFLSFFPNLFKSIIFEILTKFMEALIFILILKGS